MLDLVRRRASLHWREIVNLDGDARPPSLTTPDILATKGYSGIRDGGPPFVHLEVTTPLSRRLR